MKNQIKLGLATLVVCLILVTAASGQSVPQASQDEAVKLYRKAADQGDDEAQFNLVWALANGHGVPKDFVEAVKWYLKAADQGHAYAQNNLGSMYYNGEGLIQQWRPCFADYRTHRRAVGFALSLLVCLGRRTISRAICAQERQFHMSPAYHTNLVWALRFIQVTLLLWPAEGLGAARPR